MSFRSIWSKIEFKRNLTDFLFGWSIHCFKWGSEVSTIIVFLPSDLFIFALFI